MELDFADDDDGDDDFTDLAVESPPDVVPGAEEAKGLKDEGELAASHAEIMRILHADVEAAEGPSASVGEVRPRGGGLPHGIIGFACGKELPPKTPG